MSKRIQIGLEADLTGDKKSEIRVTPIDREAPENVILAAQTLISWLDGSDLHPNDGEADISIPGMEIAGVRANAFIRVR
jgi:hypothetical protein